VDGAVPVGAQHGNSGLLQPFQKERTGMAVRIFFPCGNYCEAVPHRVQKIRHGGVLAPVMTNFQNVGLQQLQIVFGKNRTLSSFFCIARKEKTSFAVADAKD
jgi:hypothetical protein